MTYRRIPFMYNPLRPGEGLSGSGRMHGPGARLYGLGNNVGATNRPGWPGFFQWLQSAHPEVHGPVSTAIQRLLARSAYRSPGARLHGMMVPGRAIRMRGLGQEGVDVPDPTFVDISTPIDSLPPPDFSITPPDVTLPNPSYDPTLAAVTSIEPATVTASAQANSPSLLQSITGMITAIGGAVLPLAQQQKLLAVNVARAKAGQSPLTLSQYESQTAGIQFGLNPSTQTALLWAGGIVGGIWLLGQLVRRR